MGTFQKGRAKTGGRKKGTPNKHSYAKVREALLKSFDDVGGRQWLRDLATSDPKTFSMLLSKVIPTESKISTDEGGGPIVVIRDYTGKSDSGGGE